MCSGAWLSFVLISVCYMLCLTSGATYFIGCICGSITWHLAQFEESFKSGWWMHPSFPGFEGCPRWTFHGPAYPKVHSCPAFSPRQEMVEEQWVGQAATGGQWDVSWGRDSSWQGWTSSVEFRLSRSTKDTAFARHVGRILWRLQPLNRASIWSPTLASLTWQSLLILLIRLIVATLFPRLPFCIPGSSSNLGPVLSNCLSAPSLLKRYLSCCLLDHEFHVFNQSTFSLYHS